MFYFRGTPLLVQIFLIYYGSGQFVPELRAVGLWQFFREPYFCAVLTLTLNTAPTPRRSCAARSGRCRTARSRPGARSACRER